MLKSGLEEEIEVIEAIIAAIEYGGNTGTKESAADALRRYGEKLTRLKNEVSTQTR